MKKIAIIHFLPLEYYPPATNMVNYLADEFGNDIKLFVFSTHNTKNRNIFNNNKVKIQRTAQSEGNKNKLIRLIKYIYFQLFVLFRLTVMRPKKVLYYESLSSFPVYLYKRFINKKAKIYIHYHEYTTPEQYANHSMKIERHFHKLEQKFLYKKTVWISHTNKYRLSFFLKDNPSLNSNILKYMPNYPPRSWVKEKSIKTSVEKFPLKCVYVGSLSINDTYIKEFAEWVIKQNGNISFDIFSYNLHSDTLRFLQDLKSPFIVFYNNGIEYEKIPAILSKYNIGIILYKGRTKNFEFNAPNKLFEYLSCGLDVWFPDVMKGITPYIQIKKSQRIIPVNFAKINNFDWQNSISEEKSQTNNKTYVCDTVFENLKKELQK